MEKLLQAETVLQISLRTKHSFTQQGTIIMVFWCFLGFDPRRQSGITWWVKQLQGDRLVSLVKHHTDAYSAPYKTFLLIAVQKANNKKGNLNSFPSILLTSVLKSTTTEQISFIHRFFQKLFFLALVWGEVEERGCGGGIFIFKLTNFSKCLQISTAWKYP